MITDRKLFFNNTNGGMGEVGMSLSNDGMNTSRQQMGTDNEDTDTSNHNIIYSETAVESSGATSATEFQAMRKDSVVQPTPMQNVSTNGLLPPNAQKFPENMSMNIPMDNSFNLSKKKGHIPSPTSMSEDGSESQGLMMSAFGTTSSRVPMVNNERKRSRIHLDNTNMTPSQNISRSMSRTSMSSNYQSAASPSQFSTNQIISSMSDINIKNSPNSSTMLSEVPIIHKVIPSQGPINGGIEVTLLGVRFKEGLIVKFGDNLALSTECWSDSTIITYLPPALNAGQVYVTVTDPNGTAEQQMISNQLKKAIFTYVDNTDRQLIELALQIVGLKMNGRLEDARFIAKRIVGSDGSSPGLQGSNNNSPNNINSNGQYSMDNQVKYSDEILITKVVKNLNTTSNLSMCDNLGRTLLHLASLKGYFKLVSTLIKKGARIDDKDSFDFTPLHFACVSGDVKIIRILLDCGADKNRKTKHGLLPLELFEINHGYGEKEHSDHMTEVVKMFTEDESAESGMGRKLSTSSFNSSIFDSESLQSENANSHDNEIDNEYPVYSDGSDYEDSDYEEEEDEDSDLLPIEQAHVTNEQCDEHEPGNETHKTEESAIDNTNNESLWNRVLHRINDDLPKYEDLFPRATDEGETSLTKTEQSRSGAAVLQRDISHTEDSQGSSEDEEEALQRGFNKFFQNRQNFQNDKMLLFFWIPLTLVLMTWFIFFNFGWRDNTIQYFSNLLTRYVRIGLAKILLGNERMKTAFREQFSNFQSTGILNDLIVG